MEYRRSKYIGDTSIDEVFEGTPEEIIEVLNGVQKESEDLIHDQDDAVEFIFESTDAPIKVTKEDVMTILNLEENYMRSIGIIKD